MLGATSRPPLLSIPHLLAESLAYPAAPLRLKLVLHSASWSGKGRGIVANVVSRVTYRGHVYEQIPSSEK